jgi:TetR/AcrR family transcriptional regulator
MIYHYFGGKDGLYLAVLEKTYAGIRTAEVSLKLGDRDPVDAVRELVEFTWNYFLKHPEFLSLLGTENLNRARYLRKSDRIRELHSPLVGMLSTVLERGLKPAFSAGVSIQCSCTSPSPRWAFYLSNRHTLSTIFGRDLGAPENVAERGRHLVDVVLAYSRPAGEMA